MRNEYLRQLKLVRKKCIEMGEMLHRQIEGAISAYRNRDLDLAQEVIEQDREVNEKEKEIENLCIRLLLLQQPMAHDLREVSAALKMITDMERIGDQAADIAELTEDIHNFSIKALDQAVVEMSKMAQQMVDQTMQAYEEESVEIAKSVVASDDALDKKFDALKESVSYVIQEKTEVSHDALDYLMIGKHLEKIGDYTVNVAKRCQWLAEAKR